MVVRAHLQIAPCCNGLCHADGGRYADASLVLHRANLTALYAYVSQQQQQQHSERSALHTELARSLQEARDTIEQLLPSHKQDMALVELLAHQVEGAGKKAAAELSSNTQAAESIDALLVQLQDCLCRTAPAGQAQQPTAGNGVEARSQCQQLLGCVNSLRQQLLKQCQVGLHSRKHALKQVQLACCCGFQC